MPDFNPTHSIQDLVLITEILELEVPALVQDRVVVVLVGLAHQDRVPLARVQVDQGLMVQVLLAMVQEVRVVGQDQQVVVQEVPVAEDHLLLVAVVQVQPVVDQEVLELDRPVEEVLEVEVQAEAQVVAQAEAQVVALAVVQVVVQVVVLVEVQVEAQVVVQEVVLAGQALDNLFQLLTAQISIAHHAQLTLNHAIAVMKLEVVLSHLIQEVLINKFGHKEHMLNKVKSLHKFPTLLTLMSALVNAAIVKIKKNHNVLRP